MTQLTEILELLRAIDEKLARIEATVRWANVRWPLLTKDGNATIPSELAAHTADGSVMVVWACGAVDHVHNSKDDAEKCLRERPYNVTGASERRVPRYPAADHHTELAERARKLPGGP